jgi:hypothetical protein
VLPRVAQGNPAVGDRALAVEADNDLVWFWIGSHADYDKLVERKPAKRTQPTRAKQPSKKSKGRSRG